jgi:hypothetical protein
MNIISTLYDFYQSVSWLSRTICIMWPRPVFVLKLTFTTSKFSYYSYNFDLLWLISFRPSLCGLSDTRGRISSQGFITAGPGPDRKYPGRQILPSLQSVFKPWRTILRTLCKTSVLISNFQMPENTECHLCPWQHTLGRTKSHRRGIASALWYLII